MPTFADMRILACYAVVAAGLALIGRALPGRIDMPDRGLIAGWGVVSIVFTAGGILGIPFSALAAAFFLCVGGALIRVARIGRPIDRLAVAVLFCLVPFLVVAATKQPSQTDEFMHWLPNAAYLFENHAFPATARPPSASFFPAFPYNLPFVAYLVSVLAGGLAEQAVVLFNVTLCGVLALLSAEVIKKLSVSGEAMIRRPLVTAAFFVLLVTLLNPTFVPKIVLTNYADFATSICLALAAYLLVELMHRIEAGADVRAAALYLGLVMAALVNTKEANIVLAGLLAVGAIAVAALSGRPILVRLLRALPIWLGPAIGLYAAWRWYVAVQMGGRGENKLHAVTDWQVDALPEILFNIGTVFAKKGGYAVLCAVVLALALVGLVKRRRDGLTRLAQIFVVVFLGYALFLVFTYVALFVGDTGRNIQSFWRYQMQLGPLALIIAAVFLGDKLLPLWRRFDDRITAAMSGAVVTLALVAPVAFAPKLRFDLEPPKPELAEIGRNLAKLLPSDAVMTLATPFEADEEMQVHFRAWAPGRTIHMKPRVPPEPVANAPAGSFLFLYCAPVDVQEQIGLALPVDGAVLLRREIETWKLVEYWPRQPKATHDAGPAACGTQS
ncbi:MAG TPA: hypothetical protein VF342_01515 [Alphaproteobacteria bacterium]